MISYLMSLLPCFTSVSALRMVKGLLISFFPISGATLVHSLCQLLQHLLELSAIPDTACDQQWRCLEWGKSIILNSSFSRHGRYMQLSLCSGFKPSFDIVETKGSAFILDPAPLLRLGCIQYCIFRLFK